MYLGSKTSKFCAKTGDLGNLPLGTSEQRKAFVLASRKNLPSSTPNESADSPKKITKKRHPFHADDTEQRENQAYRGRKAYKAAKMWLQKLNTGVLILNSSREK